MSRTGREYGLAVAANVAAAGAALYASSRTWLVEVITRPEPLPPSTAVHSGGSLVPLLPALALVGLAGSGGLLATRGKARMGVAVLITLAGLAIVGSLLGVSSRAGVAMGWLVVAGLGGLVLAGIGVLAMVRGRSWPTMGSRYERATVSRPAATPSVVEANDGDVYIAARAGGGSDGRARVNLWDALDRGEDPTKE